MEYVKMPELLSSEAAKVIAGNMEAVRDMMSMRDNDCGCNNEECCCPKKIKFIFVMNNVVIININAVCEEEKHGHKC